MKAVTRLIPLIIFAVLATACASSPEPDPTEPSGGVIEGQAVIEQIDLMILESFPVQVNANLSGNLADGCTTIDETVITYVESTKTFEIAVSTTRPADALCTEALVPFEQNVSLDVLGLPAGDYTVRAGDASASFNLAVDNVIPDIEEPTPSTTGRIEGRVWHDICAVAGGEGGAPAVPSVGCVEKDGGGYEADGILTPDEDGIEGVEVQLLQGDCAGPVVGTIFTNSDGAFAFDSLAAGSFCVLIDPLANPNSSILIPGDWTSAAGGNVEIDLAEGQVVPALNFGWDYQFLPDPADVPPLDPTADPTEPAEPNDPGCTNSMKFIDETVEDGTVVGAGQNFTKSWTLENTGSCRWTKQYKLVFVSGDKMNGPDSQLLTQGANFGDQVEISVTLLAPQAEGTYRGNWMLEDENGNRFGLGRNGSDPFWVEIEVEGTVTNLNLGVADWTDTFNSGANWFLVDNDQVRFTVSDGSLRMRAKVPGAAEQWGLSNQPAMDDYYLEGVFRTGSSCSGTDRYGLLVRSPNPNAGYVFNVACDGRFRVYEWDGTNYNQLQGWTSTAAIQAGPNQTNRVGVWAEGDDLKLYINDILVAEFDISIHDSGRFGLLVGSTNTTNFDVFVDEISYWRLDD